MSRSMRHKAWWVVPCTVHTVYFAMTSLRHEAGAGQIETANNADVFVQNQHEVRKPNVRQARRRRRRYKKRLANEFPGIGSLDEE